MDFKDEHKDKRATYRLRHRRSVSCDALGLLPVIQTSNHSSLLNCHRATGMLRFRRLISGHCARDLVDLWRCRLFCLSYSQEAPKHVNARLRRIARHGVSFRRHMPLFVRASEPLVCTRSPGPGDAV